jgi:hypothetical protein
MHEVSAELGEGIEPFLVVVRPVRERIPPGLAVAALEVYRPAAATNSSPSDEHVRIASEVTDVVRILFRHPLIRIRNAGPRHAAQ